MSKAFAFTLFLATLFTISFSAIQHNVLDSIYQPDEDLGDLFAAVQLQSVFNDSKTFVDCLPLLPPEQIVEAYDSQKNQSDFNLTDFVYQYFALPPQPENVTINTSLPVVEHIKQLWPILTRHPDNSTNISSLIPLPNDYIIPGGRFREVYYWDSFFTMLGLQQSNLTQLIQDIIDNFTYLIEILGHIPNGNRGYYMSRSQPPFYAMMVGILAEIKGEDVWKTYGHALLQEYNFWMDGAENLTETNSTHRHVVRLPDGSLLNRYWDDKATPRPESYKEDVLMANASGRDPEDLYRNIRAAAESGLDFTSRWFADGFNMSTIRTTELIPVDLNALMYHIELTLAKVAALDQDEELEANFTQKAEARKAALIKYCWSDEDDFFYDYDFVNGNTTNIPTLAAAYPLFFKMVNNSQAAGVANKLATDFMFPGGLPTTLTNTTQQWDAPNGWAPLQWMTIQGLKNYNHIMLADTIAIRWAHLNIIVYQKTGKLVEKYNVEDIHASGGGGEYPTQDGFGWTNGVLLNLLRG